MVRLRATRWPGGTEGGCRSGAGTTARRPDTTARTPNRPVHHTRRHRATGSTGGRSAAPAMHQLPRTEAALRDSLPITDR